MLSQAFISAAHKLGLNAIVWTHSGCRFELENTSSENYGCNEINKSIIKFLKSNKIDAIYISQSILRDFNLQSIFDGFNSLKELTNKLVIIGNTPVFPDGSKFMKSSSLFTKPYNPPRSFFIDEMISDRFDIAREMETWSHRDGNHLSVEGANLTIPYILESLESLFPDS
jgi:hypothetical protein